MMLRLRRCVSDELEVAGCLVFAGGLVHVGCEHLLADATHLPVCIDHGLVAELFPQLRERVLLDEGGLLVLDDSVAAVRTHFLGAVEAHQLCVAHTRRHRHDEGLLPDVRATDLNQDDHLEAARSRDDFLVVEELGERGVDGIGEVMPRLGRDFIGGLGGAGEPNGPPVTVSHGSRHLPVVVEELVRWIAPIPSLYHKIYKKATTLKNAIAPILLSGLEHRAWVTYSCGCSSSPTAMARLRASVAVSGA